MQDTDLSARRWAEQTDVDWIMLTGSLLADQLGTVVCPVAPVRSIPFTIAWRSDLAADSLARRFVAASLDAALPEGRVACQSLEPRA